MNRTSRLNYLMAAQEYAMLNTTCEKVVVGSLILDEVTNKIVSYGANRTVPGVCKGINSCQVDGHCVSTIHSEIDAIVRWPNLLTGRTMFVTRYPCEACARAIAASGIAKVVYGRETRVSKVTDDIFFQAGIWVVHETDFKEADPYAKRQD